MTTDHASGPAPGERARDRRPALICVALAILSLTVFARSLENGFFNLDDTFYVTENADVTNGLTLHGIGGVFAHGSPALWDPLTSISHMLDCQFYGLRPAGHHLTNILFHSTSVVLLFLFLRSLTGALWPSAFAAALFAVHPLRVESVGWVTERKDMLSGFFFMLTLAAYLRYVRQPGRKSYLLIVVLFALGLMAKAMLVTVPVVFLLLDIWPLNRWRQLADARPLITEKLPFFVMSLASGIVGFFAQGTAVITLEKVSVPLRVANSLVAYALYVEKLFWPSGLAPFYPYPYVVPIWKVALAVAVLGALTALAIQSRRRRPWVFIGWFWYVVMLVPVVGLIQLGGQSRADRYTYLPQIGLAIALTWQFAAWQPLWARWRAAVATAAVALLALLSTRTVIQLGYWHDSTTLWKRTLTCIPPNALAHYMYAGALVQSNRLDQAREHYLRAIELRPDYIAAMNNLGSICVEQGDLDQAFLQYQKVLSYQPKDAMAHYNLGVVFMKKGLAPEAIGCFQNALQLQPDDAPAEADLGGLLLQTGQFDAAVAHLEHALLLQPGLASAQTALARAAWSLATSPDAARRDGPRAVRLAQEVIRVSGGDNPGFQLALAAAFAETGQFDQAVARAEKARQLALADGNSEMARLLADRVALFQSGRPYRDEAASHAAAR